MVVCLNLSQSPSQPWIVIGFTSEPISQSRIRRPSFSLGYGPIQGDSSNSQPPLSRSDSAACLYPHNHSQTCISFVARSREYHNHARCLIPPPTPLCSIST